MYVTFLSLVHFIPYQAQTGHFDPQSDELCWITLLGAKHLLVENLQLTPLYKGDEKKKLKLLSQRHHKVNKIQTPDHWDYTYKQCQSLSCHMLYSPPLGTANLATNSKALVTQDSQQLHQ